MNWAGSHELETLLGYSKDRIFVFDTETTGFDPKNDDILQLSVVDGNGTVVFSSLFKPELKQSWPEAEKVNGITPEMVANERTFSEVKKELNTLFHHADLLVGYNISFDSKFIHEKGIYFKTGSKTFDVMKEFSSYRCYVDPSAKSSWCKLSECANFYGYSFNAHDALEDTNATLYCFNQLIADEKFRKLINDDNYGTNAATYDKETKPASQPEVTGKKKLRLVPAGILLVLLGLLLANIASALSGFIILTGFVMIIIGIRRKKLRKK